MGDTGKVWSRLKVYNTASNHLIDDQGFTVSTFDRVEPFVVTAERRSFRGAARHLGLSPTAVSKAVAALEADLGVRLLQRTSRHVALTPEGEIYLQHARQALDSLQAGRDRVALAAQVAEGRLRVSLSPVLGRPVVAALPRLLSRHPRIQVHLAFSDVAVNLVEQEVDVALRTGELDDVALVARPLQAPRWVTVAAPTYLARAGEPREVADLGTHTCLQFARPNGQVAGWRFAGEGKTPPFLAERPLVLDQGDLLVSAAAAGLGLAQVFDFMVRDEIHRGALVEVLPRLSLPGPPLHAVCLPGRQKVPKIRAFLDLVVEAFGGGVG